MSRLSRTSIRRFSIQDASELFNVDGWGSGFFQINTKGHVEVTPTGPEGPSIDLKHLVDDLVGRGLNLPILIRFSDILNARIKQLTGAFQEAIEEHAYRGSFHGVYPIKVNQQRHVVEEILEYGRPLGFGVEAGSKPEFLIAIALQKDPATLILCNGYKDRAYVETALLAGKLGQQVILIVDQAKELDLIISTAKRLCVTPRIGLRARLVTKGAGKWVESTGDRSKFGLSSAELVTAVERLRDLGLLEALELLHFHIGSQITAIRAIKEALREASRIYVELWRLGAKLRFLDCGGGLGVDYDGSHTNFHSSVNYSLKEYAADIVSQVMESCDAAEIPHPDIITESGRALVAHHSLLVFNTLSTNEMLGGRNPSPPTEEENRIIQNLHETWQSVSRKTFQEAYHDALQGREEAVSSFNLGLLSLKERARVEEIFFATCEKILRIVRSLDYVPDELEGLERQLADTFYCNFSVFQSLPDHWAVRQLFPTLPIQRLDEEPTRRAVLADLTCDSDGRMDRFIDLHDVKDVLELHRQDGRPYYLASFLVGAYQEILGDLHNLFGDTDAAHVRLDAGSYLVEHVVEGDSVAEVLHYVQYERRDLVARLRRAIEHALRQGTITLAESRRLMRRYEEALEGSTYLAEPEETRAGQETGSISLEVADR